MSVDVSVVVPVYNSELFLRQCMDSLLAQTLKNVEFIFVDDGSTDRSLEILREYQQKDPRITILQQQNQYAGVARNNGMKLATGKYIIFLDSDDFFEPTMLEEAFNCAEAHQAQIVMFGFFRYDNETKSSKLWLPGSLPDGVFSAEQAGERLFQSLYAAPWNKLYQREYVDRLGVFFQPVRKCNDEFFTLSTIALSDRIIHLNKALLHYRINNPTSLQGNKAFSCAAFIDPLISVKDFLKQNNRYNGPIRDAYLHYADIQISYFEKRAAADFEIQKSYYYTVKGKLLPGIYDSRPEIKMNSIPEWIYESSCIEDFLVKLARENWNCIDNLHERIKELYNSTVSKKSMDYRIGHFLLIVPRLILRLFHRRKNI